MPGRFFVFLPFLLAAILPSGAAARLQDPLEECTAGVASGRATADGRPLLWKTRDASATDNEVIWNTSGTYPFVSVISAGDPSSSWMGVNEKGFAIINTLSTDLTAGRTGLHNGLFMAYALEEAATVEEFEELLKETNESGRMTNTNFGVIDATGAAAFFETAGHEYWRYDAADTEKGYILRTNFAVNGDRSRGDPPGSMDRFLQTERLMIDFYRTGEDRFQGDREDPGQELRNQGGGIGPSPLYRVRRRPCPWLFPQQFEHQQELLGFLRHHPGCSRGGGSKAEHHVDHPRPALHWDNRTLLAGGRDAA